MQTDSEEDTELLLESFLWKNIPEIPVQVQVGMKRITHLTNKILVCMCLVGEGWSRVSRCCSPHLSDPACLHCLWPVYLCMCHDPGWAPLRVHRGMSSLEARPRPVPQGCCMPAICWLSPAVSQSATQVTGWEGDNGGIEDGGGVWQRGQQMPAEATGDLPESILLHLPPLLSCNWWWTCHHCLSCDLFGKGGGWHSLSPLTCADCWLRLDLLPCWWLNPRADMSKAIVCGDRTGSLILICSTPTTKYN